MRDSIMEVVRNTINSFASKEHKTIHLSKDDILLISNVLTRIKLNKNGRLYENTKSLRCAYFVERGLLCLLSDRHIIVDFILPNTLTFCFAESGCRIEALEKSTVWKVDTTSLITMLEGSANLKTITCSFFEQLLTEQMNRLLFVINKSPEERYAEIVKTRKELIQLVSLKHLASYIGVTPQGLSRIRKRYALKQI